MTAGDVYKRQLNTLMPDMAARVKDAVVENEKEDAQRIDRKEKK